MRDGAFLIVRSDWRSGICDGDIRPIAFRLRYACETIPGLRTRGSLRLLRTSCVRA